MLSLSDPAQFLTIAFALIVAIAVHEFSHAFLADRLGDPTPRLQGRLTLNPLVHLDPIGTLMLFFIGFGWGKPVQFDPYNLRNPQRDAALISFAGPASNIIVAALFAILVRVFPESAFLTLPLIRLNVFLAVFNLIPVHPLDGGKVLIGLLEAKTAQRTDAFLSRYGLIILIFLILPIFSGAPLVLTILSPLINLLLHFFLP